MWLDAVVVDASAICAVAFGESSTDDVVRRVDGRRMIAPTLLRYEFASTALEKQRQEPGQRELLRRALELSARL